MHVAYKRKKKILEEAQLNRRKAMLIAILPTAPNVGAVKQNSVMSLNDCDENVLVLSKPRVVTPSDVTLDELSTLTSRHIVDVLKGEEFAVVSVDNLCTVTQN